MSISTALKARQEALRDREAGFTLIELLVVVIIIGILAAIAIPVYLGVQNNAKDTAVKSDLTNAKTAIISAATDYNGALPTAVTSAGSATVPNGTSTATVNLVDKGWSVSSNTTSLTYAFNSTTNAWCIVGLGSTNNKFVVTSSASGVTSTSAATCTP